MRAGFVEQAEALAHYCHHHLPPHNAITEDIVRTLYGCMNIQHNYPILIS